MRSLLLWLMFSELVAAGFIFDVARGETLNRTVPIDPALSRLVGVRIRGTTLIRPCSLLASPPAVESLESEPRQAG